MGTSSQHAVLCATDFSEGARRALDVAVDLGRALGVVVWVAHVMDTATDAELATDPGVARAAHVMRERVQARVARARAELDAEIARVDGRAEGVVLDGHPVEAIVAHAAKLDASFIVIGAHGAARGSERIRDATLGWVLGTTAERVVRSAGRPVLVVPLAK